MVIRGASFDTESRANGSGYQDITTSRRVLGSLNGEIAAPVTPIRVAVHGPEGSPPVQAVVDQLNDDSHFDFSAELVNSDQLASIAQLANFDVVATGDCDALADISIFTPALRKWVEAGGGLVSTGPVAVCAASHGVDISDLDAIASIDLSASANVVPGHSLKSLAPEHPIMQGLDSFQLEGNSVEYQLGQIKPWADVIATIDASPGVVVGMPGGVGHSVYLSPLYLDDPSRTQQYRNSQADRLLEQAVAWSASRDHRDEYVFTAQPGNVLDISSRNAIRRAWRTSGRSDCSPEAIWS